MRERDELGLFYKDDFYFEMIYLKQSDMRAKDLMMRFINVVQTKHWMERGSGEERTLNIITHAK